MHALVRGKLGIFASRKLCPAAHHLGRATPCQAGQLCLPIALHTCLTNACLPPSFLQVAISPIGSPDNPDLASLASGSLSPHAHAAALASLASGSLSPHAHAAALASLASGSLAAAAAGATATFSLVPLPTGEAAGLDGLSK